MDIIGIDLGTSGVKAARFVDGTRVETAVEPVRRVERRGLEVTQDLRSLLDAADATLDRLGPAGAIAVTAQRDTLLLGDVLVSWMDGRAGTGSFWDCVSAGEVTRTGSVISALLERWTGRAVEGARTWPRQLRGAERERFEADGGTGTPAEAALGERAGVRRGVPVYIAGGDKNCELLAVRAGAGRAGLSLGTGISLGASTERDLEVPGTVRSRAAFGDRWDVETGLVVGMQALDGFAAWLPGAAPGAFVSDLWMLPHFAGALDGPAVPALIGLRPDTGPERILAAWAQGVVAELVRLRPKLEAAVGAIDAVVVTGGGSGDAWARLVADGFACPAAVSEDRFAGCRGACDAVLLSLGEPRLPAVAPVWIQPRETERFARWMATWRRWFDGLREA